MRNIGFLIVCIALCSSASAQSIEKEEEALRELWSRFGKSYAARDAEGVASLYADDADRYARVSQKATGREEILEQYRRELDRRAAELNAGPYRPTEITIRFLRPDVAILDGVSSPTATTRVYFTVIATKEDGKWWLAAGRPRGRVTE